MTTDRKQTLAKLRRLGDKRQRTWEKLRAENAELFTVVQEANEQGINKSLIAKTARLSRQTVHTVLGNARRA